MGTTFVGAPSGVEMPAVNGAELGVESYQRPPFAAETEAPAPQIGEQDLAPAPAQVAEQTAPAAQPSRHFAELYGDETRYEYSPFARGKFLELYFKRQHMEDIANGVGNVLMAGEQDPVGFDEMRMHTALDFYEGMWVTENKRAHEPSTETAADFKARPVPPFEPQLLNPLQAWAA